MDEQQTTQAQETQQQQETQQPQQQETQPAQAVQVVRLDDVRALVAEVAQDAGHAAAGEVTAQVTEQVGAVSEQLGTLGTVTLTSEQYDGLRQVMATQLHGTLAVVGVASILLGVLLVMQATQHWRSR